jgi:hypothetical protein
MPAKRSSIGGFEENEARKTGSRRAGRIFGAIPPARKSPPVARYWRAEFPASEP